MATITPAFLYDLESNMRTITSQEYGRLTSKLWWQSVAKTMPSMALKERLTWLLDTARIQRTGHGGNIEFEDIVSLTTEVENLNAAAGLTIKKEKFEDVDGNGINYAAQWSRTVGSYASYWPQKCVAQAILANPPTYDGKPYFAKDHPTNPFRLAAGTYANVFTGAPDAPTRYPGALPIHDDGTDDQSAGGVSVAKAISHLSKAIAYISGTIKMPNGEDPRFLRVASLFVPPAMVARAQQLTNAKFIAQVAATGAAGSGDVEAIIRNFGLGQPIEVPELGGAFPGGSDTTWYLGLEDILTNELGSFSYINRESFSVLYYGPQTDPSLARIREFQWTTEGRNSVLPGHPYLFHKMMAT
jgi:hypothetical protein